jgi:hypothetical protein
MSGPETPNYRPKRSKEDIQKEIAELRAEIALETPRSKVAEIFKGFGEGVIVKGDVERCTEVSKQMTNDELYMSLYDAFSKTNNSQFSTYLYGLIFELEAFNKLEKTEKIGELIGKIKEIRGDYCERTPKYYDPEVEKYIKEMKEDGVIRKKGEGFYERVGLSEEKMSRPAELFIELAMRREFSIHDWVDDVQETMSKHFTVLPHRSIGPLEIQPHTYLKALLLKNGLESKGDYEKDMEMALAEDILQTERQLIYRILNKPTAMDAFEDILAMYMTRPGEAVEVLLNKNGDLRKYKIPLKAHYTFSTKDGGQLRISHDDLRLMAALAKYQGKGLRFLSPDEQIAVNGNEVVLEERLVLNNVVTEICIA